MPEHDPTLRFIIEALFKLSKQIQSCERKLNKLLEKQGEDAQILRLSEALDDSTDALQAVLNAHQPQQPTKKESL